MTEWLKIMLGEVDRKREDQARAEAELKLRQSNTESPTSKSS